MNLLLLKIQVELTGLEGPVLEGELVPCVAHLKNTGSVTLRSLRLLVTEPDLFCCPSDKLHSSRPTSLAGSTACLLGLDEFTLF